jgi:hypothetical protein
MEGKSMNITNAEIHKDDKFHIRLLISIPGQPVKDDYWTYEGEEMSGFDTGRFVREVQRLIWAQMPLLLP